MVFLCCFLNLLMAASSSPSSSFMLAVRFLLKGQFSPTLARMIRLDDVPSKNHYVTFADVDSFCVCSALSRSFYSVIVMEFVTSSVLDLNHNSSVSFDRDSVSIPLEMTCRNFSPPHVVVLFKVRSDLSFFGFALVVQTIITG